MINQIIKLKRMIMTLEEEIKEKNLEIQTLKKEITKLQKAKGGTTIAKSKKKA